MDFCEFLSEDELIEIVPNFNHDKVLHLINGDFGPFTPAVPVKVPLWMALNLFSKQKCKINVPQWLIDIEELWNEQKNNNGLIQMPCDHWIEVARALEKCNIPMPNAILTDLIARRENILKNSVRSLLDEVVNLDEDQIAQVKIKNITKFELAKLKKVILPNLAISKNIQKY